MKKPKEIARLLLEYNLGIRPIASVAGREHRISPEGRAATLNTGISERPIYGRLVSCTG